MDPMVLMWKCLQFTEEKLGRTERTEYEAEFQQLEKKTDLTKGYTEKIKNNTAAVIIPNPSKIQLLSSLYKIIQ